MGFYIGIALVLLVLAGMVWVIARRGPGRSGGGPNLRDGQSYGGEGARTTTGTQRNNLQVGDYGQGGGSS